MTARRASNKRADRAERYTHRHPDPNDPDTLISHHPDCPHGTERGYVEYGCRGADCTRAGSTAAATRRRNRINANASTLRIWRTPPPETS
ncbi:hypothetical protein [Pseudonocardia sp. NPDC049635]|uniref:hypothetical protein n=1 Tax=Pseudonocardia sp. NPDC049635 TaxID=3155506 RepID=UPI0033E1942E